jgi:predicted transcriptional regulator
LPTLEPDSATVTIDGPALRRLRLDARISQGKLAELSDGVHSVTICNYERGAYKRSSELTVLRLADGLTKALGRTVAPDEFTAPLEPEPAEIAS